MTTERLYLDDTYRRKLRTHVVRCEPAGPARFLVELERTILYPGGGGQPPDHGWIGGIRVTGSETRSGRVVHLAEAPVAQSEVEVRLDWGRRYDHMQQHTAQHVLTVVAARELGWATMGFGIGAKTSYIDLDVKHPMEEDLRRLEDLAAAEIRAARRVRTLWVGREEMGRLPVRSRRLPKEPPDRIRLVEIEGLDLNTCGGTHVANTAEVEALCLVGVQPMHGGTRVTWVAGGRVRRRMAAREELLARLRALIGASDAELAEVVELKLARLREAQAEVDRLRERRARSIAEELTGEAGPVVARMLEEPEMVWAVAAVLAGCPGSGAYLLAAPDGSFALALGRDLDLSAEELGPLAARELGARGGGRDRLYRGRARRPGSLEAAAARVSERLRR